MVNNGTRSRSFEILDMAKLKDLTTTLTLTFEVFSMKIHVEKQKKPSDLIPVILLKFNKPLMFTYSILYNCSLLQFISKTFMNEIY